jgi:PAS domain S-box-containing protein
MPGTTSQTASPEYRPGTDGHSAHHQHGPSDILEHAPAIIYVYDVIDRHSVYQNRSLSEILGFAPGDVAEAGSWHELIHPEDAQRFPAHRKALEALKQGGSALFEYRLRDAQGKWRWLVSRDVPFQFEPSGKVRLIVGTAADASERRLAEERNAFLLKELNHRMANALAMVSSIIFMTYQTQGGGDFLKEVTARIKALQAASQLLVTQGWHVAPLRELVRNTVENLVGESDRVHCEGPDDIVDVNDCMPLALAFHELTTNAMKYGALSSPTGKIDISWTNKGGELRIRWKETGGPAVSPPTRQGFGLKLIEGVFADHVAPSIDFAPDGLCCTLEIPARPAETA